MDIQITATYGERGNILATFDSGPEMAVPDNAGNRHRQMIAEWETEGNEIAPFTAPSKAARTTGTFREFMALFTDEETAGIIAATQSSVDIKLWYDQALAGDVWLGHVKVAGGLAALVSIGLLTAERAEEILATDFDA